MNICHVNLAGGFRGGERQTLTLIAALAQQPNIQQTLVCRQNSPMRELAKDIPNLSFATARAAWQGHFATRQTDIVHAHEARAAHWAWIHQRIHQTPYLITRRVDFHLKNNWFTNQVYQNAHVLVAISNAIAEKMHRFAPPKIVLTDTCSPLPEDAALSASLAEQFKHKFVIGHIGALVDSHKGQADLIEVARRFATQYPDCVFLFLGDGEDKAKFQTLSRDLNHVYWLGFQANIGSYLRVLDLFAFPSRTEGLGSTLLDAMAYQVPIVATRVGGIPDIIQDKQNGLLVPTGDVDALAQAIETLYQSPSMRETLVRNAQQTVHQYAPDALAAQYFRIYQQILAN